MACEMFACGKQTSNLRFPPSVVVRPLLNAQRAWREICLTSAYDANWIFVRN